MKLFMQEQLQKMRPIHLLYGLYGFMILVCLLVKAVA